MAGRRARPAVRTAGHRLCRTRRQACVSDSRPRPAGRHASPLAREWFASPGVKNAIGLGSLCGFLSVGSAPLVTKPQARTSSVVAAQLGLSRAKAKWRSTQCEAPQSGKQDLTPIPTRHRAARVVAYRWCVYAEQMPAKPALRGVAPPDRSTRDLAQRLIPQANASERQSEPLASSAC